jgi:threonine/homoserine/homoserine lactone efflux protein
VDPTLFLRGLVIGFGIAAAVGPISILAIRRTLASGFLVGLASGLGVAAADATYGAIAAFGITAVSDVLIGARRALGLIGGVFLVWLGVRTVRAVPALEPAADPEAMAASAAGGASTAPAAGSVARRRNLVTAFLSIYALTMTNPMTILSFVAIFAGLGLAIGVSFLDAAALTLGVWAGSTLWWVVLTVIVTWLRERVSARALLWINRVSGGALVFFGIAALAVALT